MTRIRKTTAKGIPIAVETAKNHVDDEDTHTDGPNLLPQAESGELSLNPSVEDFDLDGFEATGELTIDRGSKPPQPSQSRRLSPTLMKIFQRRREQIGLSIKQLAQLSGVEQEELERFEATSGQHRLVYDHAVVLARALGLKASELPGLRGREPKDDLRAHIDELHRALCAGPLITFEGKEGERFGGDVDRVVTTPAFTIKLGDASLGEGWPAGALLGFGWRVSPRRDDVVLLRHRKSKLLALRRMTPPRFVGLASWQPAYPATTGAEWLAMGRLQVILPRPL